MNLKELSAHLGLSQTTVSRALNGYPEVGEATRARVLEAANRFGYRPSQAARRLATGTAHALGIVFPVERNVLLDPLFVEYLAGVSETAGRHRFDILISPAETGNEIATYARLARSGTVDAVLISGPALHDPRLERLIALDFPAIVHGRPAEALPLPSLDIDNRSAFAQATRYLIHLGHRRIALVNGDERLTFALDRRAGVEDALAAAGLALDAGLCTTGPMTVDTGYSAARVALSSPTGRPTAFLCSSVFVALGVLRALGEAGLKVPEDVSIIAHDDEMPAFRADYMTPALTTTRSSIRAAGRRIAEIALARIAGTLDPTAREVWPVDLVVRASTGPAPPL